MSAASLIRTVLVVVLVSPLVTIATLSLSPTKGMDFFMHPSDASLRWWNTLSSDPSWVKAAVTSVSIAALSTMLALLLVTPAVVYARLSHARWSRWLVASAGAAFFIPPVVLAVGLYGLVQVSGLFDTIPGLAVAHLSVTAPVLGFILSERLKISSDAAYLVARTLGARPIPATITWIISQHRPTVISALSAAFMGSMSEATLVFFVTDTQTNTIARRVMSGLSQDIDPSGYAAMVVWLLIVGCIAVLIGPRKQEYVP